MPCLPAHPTVVPGNGEIALATPGHSARDPADFLREALGRAGLVAPEAAWTALAGGRTNAIWRIDAAPHPLVCKLFRENGGTPLFPNQPKAEIAALRALDGSGIAPRFVAVAETALGICLIYRHVAGRPWRRDGALAGRLLARLHSRTPPKGLRRILSGSDALRRQGQRILDGCASPQAERLRNLCPEARSCPEGQATFLHGDAVPANIICSRKSAVLIDWQCPGRGDPCEDLFTFLSPAMQRLYGPGPLPADEERAFLAAYANPAVAERLACLRPLLHWRMAAHCLWKAERGDADYREGMELEIEALARAMA